MPANSNKISSLLLTVTLVALTAFTIPKEKDVLSAKLIDKNVAKVNDSIYAYRYETSNSEYNHFLESIRQTNPALYQSCIQDTAVWLSDPVYNKPLVEYYHRHPGFTNYPVIGVSYDAALQYCQWLTDLYNNDSKKDFKQVQFILPTQEQWEEAASAGRKEAMFPWGNYYLRNRKGEFLCNFKHINESSIISGKDGKPVVSESIGNFNFSSRLNNRSMYTVPVRSFYPNDFGLYNMCGNAAEMVAEKGISKGGSYNSYGGEIHIRVVGHYTGTNNETGFRVFMKVIEK